MTTTGYWRKSRKGEERQERRGRRKGEGGVG